MTFNLVEWRYWSKYTREYMIDSMWKEEVMDIILFGMVTLLCHISIETLIISVSISKTLKILFADKEMRKHTCQDQHGTI